MEADDAYSKIEAAFEARVRACVDGLKRVLRPDDLPATEAQLPATCIECGDEDIAYLASEGPGTRLEGRRVQVDVILILDEGADDYRVRSRRMVEQLRAGLCDPTLFTVPIDDIELKAVRPQRFASEKGSQGGFHLAFLVTVLSAESTPWTLEPRQ